MKLLRFLLVAIALASAAVSPAAARPVAFDVPAQRAANALLAFSRQAEIEVLYSFAELNTVPANAVVGTFEPEDALNRLLRNTGFAARRNLRGKFVVARATLPTGAIAGRVAAPGNEPAAGVMVAIADTRLRTTADATGHFEFPAVPPGTYRVFAGGHGYRPLEIPDVRVIAGQTTTLASATLAVAGEITELEPYLVRDRNDRLPIGEGVGAPPRRAAGNLDLPRTEDNALPFTLFTREQIAHSGVVQLNEFFQRELLDTFSNSPPPEQNGGTASFVTGSSNLTLRGYDSDQTIVLVNGRRLPETFTDSPAALGMPDVNLVPLSLVDQVQVLPVSASALYSGNAVGGVINIVLRPERDGTELRTTYTNALGGFDAPQSTVSLQHGRTLLDGKLKLLLNVTATRTDPALESELHLQRRRLAATTGLEPRATPNVTGVGGAPLAALGQAAYTSVAPGASGTGGLAAFAGRGNVRNTDLFDAPGGLAASINSLDFPYGRRQRRLAWYGSAVWDVLPRLQLGLDASYARTTVHRGYDVFGTTLTLPASSPFNPFGQPVLVALNESPVRFGPDFNLARLTSYSVVGGALLKLPGDWQLSLDGQYARNVARYRGLVGADHDRWQQLVDSGAYNPLRDTQVVAPPDAFYDRVLIHYGRVGEFVTLGDYTTFEGTVRLTHEALPLPTGVGTTNLGADYRLSHLAPYTQAPRFADGTPAPEITEWTGRTLERISVFGEMQAPLVPAPWLPRGVKSLETDLAARYTVSAQANETNLAPTFGLKADFAGGFSLRGSLTTSNRFPTPRMSRPLGSGAGGGSTADLQSIYDPLRNERYAVEAKVAVNPNVRAEEAATQSFGVVWQHGKTHRVRASLDFTDTRKTNEFINLEADQVVNLESIFPDRVVRATTPPADTAATPLRITTLLTGPANAARRHSQNWSLSADYNWHGFAGGRLELRGRWVWYQRYDVQLRPGDAMVDELGSPQGSAPNVLRQRLSFGAGWSNPAFGFGFDTQYLGARKLPQIEWAAQGGSSIGAYWQVDAYAQAELTHWWQRRPERLRLTAQVRVNNLSNFAFPKYAGNPLGTGVQPYGDWRGRTLSLSLNAEF